VNADSIALVGDGVVGGRIAQRLPLVADGGSVVHVDTRRSLKDLQGCSLAVLAHSGGHAELAADLVRRGVSVISISDDLDDVRALLDLDGDAESAGASLVVGAGMSPGLTGLLARYLVSQMASSDEIHISLHGTAGPSCARHQHRALAGRALAYQDGRWVRPPAGSGRELCWFPEPVGAYDCYFAEIPSPLLLHDDFPDASRLSERISANRRDRLTARLPMLSRPHREGGVGAVRVEVRGSDDSGGRTTMILGVAELVGTVAAATATSFVGSWLRDELPAGVIRPSDARLNTTGLLHSIERLGVRLQEFTGVPSVLRIGA